MVLFGVKEARDEAIRTASELLRGDREDVWSGPDWSIRVTDETRRPVFTIKILMDHHGIRAEY
jgi:hypothetical protein